ncbi:MAG: TIGR04372 family glycosyltransferase [Nitrospirae bacterium]|nr:TIGR04372 family glycosyltransferase [Nitrospirota bacterium]
MNTDHYLKKGILGLRPKYYDVAIITIPNQLQGVHVNHCLLDYWREYLRVIDTGIVDYSILYRLLLPVIKNKFVCMKINKDQQLYPTILNEWGDRKPLLQLKDKHIEDGIRTLSRMGLPDDAWYVCLHCRDDAFKPHLKHYSFRSVDINTYTLACEEIIKRGGWIIRMGDVSMKSYSPHSRIIDYAHSAFKNDDMDIFLTASCRFFIGCSSGLHTVAFAFGIPVVLVNLVPMHPISYGINDISITKIIYNESEKRFLNFREMFLPELNDDNSIMLFDNIGCVYVDNTDEEIREIIIEMLDNLEGKAVYSKEDELLQAKFKSLIPMNSLGYASKARIGRNFLKKHKQLLF